MSVETRVPEAVAPSSPALSWQTQAFITGGLAGLLLGVLSAFLYVRASEENARSGQPNRVKTGDAMRLTLAVLTLVRQISELGNR